ncbi:hypothetical protein bmyco0003_52770 [Bacillus pseudomycoides]|nr:hypothetical protein bmyco0003_52770 [Bacillus pseudomycoides]
MEAVRKRSFLGKNITFLGADFICLGLIMLIASNFFKERRA